MAKYKNVKTETAGLVFDSKKEAKRYQELIMMEQGKVIHSLQTQVKFELIPKQRVEGVVVELPMSYVADFVYQRCSDDKKVVEDVKSDATRKLPIYIAKRKLMLWVHGIQIQEV